MSKKLLVVFGATGNQGGSTAHFVLDDPELSSQYAVRAITRSASNPKAQELKAKGAEVVEADLENPASLPAALKGVHTIFAQTNTQYGGNTKEIETKQARALLSEAVNQGAQYVIWSSMSHPFKISNGALAHVDLFDVKAEIEQDIRKLPIKSAFFAPGSFMQNFLTQMRPKPSPANDGTYVLGNMANPTDTIPLIDITDTGKWVGAILAARDEYEGKFFAAADRMYTWGEVADVMSKVVGKTVVHKKVPDDVMKGFFPPGAREGLYEMWLLFREYGYFGATSEEQVRWASEQARGKLTSLEEFLRKVDYKLE